MTKTTPTISVPQFCGLSKPGADKNGMVAFSIDHEEWKAIKPLNEGQKHFNPYFQACEYLRNIEETKDGIVNECYELSDWDGHDGLIEMIDSINDLLNGEYMRAKTESEGGISTEAFREITNRVFIKTLTLKHLVAIYSKMRHLEDVSVKLHLTEKGILF